MQVWKRVFFVITLLCFFLLSKVSAQSSIILSVDATDAPRKILHSRESLTVPSGALTLFYPKWVPGEHGPTGPVADFVGLKISAAGTLLPWRRDLDEMYAIHCEVPGDLTTIEVTFDFVLPPEAEGFSSGASSSAQLVIVSWNQVVLYPMSDRPDNITVTPSLKLPDGWKFGTALEVEQQSAGELHFKAVSLSKLVDSPVLTGAHFRRIDISAGLPTPHFLNLASDGDAAIDMSKEQIAIHERLVLEANALFGAHHYNHYDFLYTLSDQVAHFGLEHHQSSDDRVDERTLLDDDLRKVHASLLSHEFVHSWNGKYRRPAGLATGDFSSPMKGDLLWVYEGLTQYLGNLLAARSGLRTSEEYREHLAMIAASLDNRPGRTWRPLQDAADEAQILYNARSDWESYRRETDFYDEGDLIWLDVDVRIRQLTGGKKSLDDFCKLFHGGENTGPMVKTYTFEDVVAALNAVAKYDWQTLLKIRLQSLDARAPLSGIEMGGWKLVFRDTMNGMEKSYEEARKHVYMLYSLGIDFSEDGTMADVVPGTPAAKAGLAPGMKLIAVNGRKFTKYILHDAVRAAKNTSAPIEFLAMSGDYFKSYVIDYHGGERYPHLERDKAKADFLGTIIKPLITKREK